MGPAGPEGSALNARTLILAILNQQAASGYEIRKMCVEGPYCYFIDISFGSIYPTLARLEADGLVTSRVEQAKGKPDRKVYSVTAAGRAEFVRAMAQPPARDVFKSEFLLVAMAAEFSTPECIAQAVQERTAFLESQVAMIREQIADCDHPGILWVARYGIHLMKCDLEYLKYHRDDLMALAASALPERVAAE